MSSIPNVVMRTCGHVVICGHPRGLSALVKENTDSYVVHHEVKQGSCCCLPLPLSRRLRSSMTSIIIWCEKERFQSICRVANEIESFPRQLNPIFYQPSIQVGVFEG